MEETGTIQALPQDIQRRILTEASERQQQPYRQAIENFNAVNQVQNQAIQTQLGFNNTLVQLFGNDMNTWPQAFVNEYNMGYNNLLFSIDAFNANVDYINMSQRALVQARTTRAIIARNLGIPPEV